MRERPEVGQSARLAALSWVAYARRSIDSWAQQDLPLVANGVTKLLFEGALGASCSTAGFQPLT